LETLHCLPDRTKDTRAEFFYHLRYPEELSEYRSLARLHKEVQDIHPELAEALDRNDCLHKYHFPPTERNQDLLRKTRKVVLLRDPIEVIRAYWRGDRVGTHPVKDVRFLDCFSEAKWLARAEQLGLLHQIAQFCVGWKHHDGDKLVVDYSELLGKPKETVNKVERYLGLPISSEVELATERYSRNRSAPPKWLLVPRLIARRLPIGAKAGTRLLLTRMGLLRSVRSYRRKRRTRSLRQDR
jgi:hypothetical protein